MTQSKALTKSSEIIEYQPLGHTKIVTCSMDFYEEESRTSVQKFVFVYLKKNRLWIFASKKSYEQNVYLYFFQ